jgi:coenzyme F420-reducing hydrogenase beta subunit
MEGDQLSVLGRYRGLYAGHASEGEYRMNGSSGGMGTWLLTELLATHLVDGVIHVKPTPGSGSLFGYRISRTAGEVAEGAKSRYYPAHLADVLADAVERGGRYALTAIPSFAYEVRLLQRLRPEYLARIPYVVGLICGHHKTANYALQLAWRAGIRPDEL